MYSIKAQQNSSNAEGVRWMHFNSNFVPCEFLVSRSIWYSKQMGRVSGVYKLLRMWLQLQNDYQTRGRRSRVLKKEVYFKTSACAHQECRVAKCFFLCPFFFSTKAFRTWFSLDKKFPVGKRAPIMLHIAGHALNKNQVFSLGWVTSCGCPLCCEAGIFLPLSLRSICNHQQRRRWGHWTKKLFILFFNFLFYHAQLRQLSQACAQM